MPHCSHLKDLLVLVLSGPGGEDDDDIIKLRQHLIYELCISVEIIYISSILRLNKVTGLVVIEK
jgi:hypothetical protein